VSFLLSSLALVAGPFLFVLGARQEGVRLALDGFVVMTLAGIVCLHIVPDAWRLAGLVSLVFLALGLLFPLLLEAVFARALERAHGFVVVLAAVGIGVHGTLDGIALIPLAEGGLLANELALGVIIHRLPVGMAIWWALKPEFGTRAAVGMITLVIGATGLGFLLGANLSSAGASPILACFQSFVAGSLVHVVLFGRRHDHGASPDAVAGHEHDHDAQTARMGSWYFRLGLLVGMAAVLVIPHVHG
jgi:hypothetical protein